MEIFTRRGESYGRFPEARLVKSRMPATTFISRMPRRAAIETWMPSPVESRRRYVPHRADDAPHVRNLARQVGALPVGV